MRVFTSNLDCTFGGGEWVIIVFLRPFLAAGNHNEHFERSKPPFYLRHRVLFENTLVVFFLKEQDRYWDSCIIHSFVPFQTLQTKHESEQLALRSINNKGRKKRKRKAQGRWNYHQAYSICSITSQICARMRNTYITQNLTCKMGC